MRTLILTYPRQLAEDASLEGKCLQLQWAGRASLVFAGRDEHRYHNQILARFLSEQGVPHRCEGPSSLVADAPGLKVIGGGRFRLDPGGKTLRVWDASSVYGRFDASALSAQLAGADPPWHGLALSVA